LLNTFDLPSYWLAEAAAYYTRGRFRAQVNVENLFDKRYFPASYNYEYVIPGNPFGIRAEVGFTF
jgi:outer membrane receptor protein involved in Fe transport